MMTDQKIAEYLLNLLEAGGGTVAKTGVTDKLPFLSDVEIARIFAEYAPDVRETIVAGIPCWQRISLPTDIKERLAEIVSLLQEINYPVSQDNIEFALCLHYEKNFCATYGLDTDEFHNLLKRHGICRKIVPTDLYDLKGESFTASKWKTYVKGWNNPKRREIVELRKNMTFDGVVEITGMAKNEVAWLLWIDKNMPLVLMKNNLTESDIIEEHK